MRNIDSEPLYRDGRHYDRQNAGLVADIPFYSRLVKRYGDPLLELACGTGRITIPLGEEGYRVTGLDTSPGMLREAERKAVALGVGIDWVEADCRDFDLQGRFALILIPFNSLSHLHDRASLEACLSCVRKHLGPHGRLVIDVFNPSLAILTRDPNRRYPVCEYEDPDGRGKVVLTESNRYDAATQVNRINWFYQTGEGGEETVQQLNMRIFFPQELDSLLHYNGFVVEKKYGDYDESPFSSASPHQLVVASLRP